MCGLLLEVVSLPEATYALRENCSPFPCSQQLPVSSLLAMGSMPSSSLLSVVWSCLYMLLKCLWIHICSFPAVSRRNVLLYSSSLSASSSSVIPKLWGWKSVRSLWEWELVLQFFICWTWTSCGSLCWSPSTANRRFSEADWDTHWSINTTIDH